MKSAGAKGLAGSATGARIGVAVHVGAAVLAAILALTPVRATAAAGALDPSFGIGGIVTFNMQLSTTRVDAMVEQPDGRIVVAASNGSGGAIVARYLPNGALDAAFGGTGYVAVSAAQRFAGVGLQRSGNIVIAAYGTVGNDVGTVLARFLPSGAVDGTFGSGGVQFFPWASLTLYPIGMAVAPDDKLVVAGSEQPANIVGSPRAARFNPDGSLDATFGAGGYVAIEADVGVLSGANSVAFQPDGKVLLAGTRGGSAPAVYRLLANGALDASFGNAGRAIPGGALGTFGALRAISLRADGRILVAGQANVGQPVIAPQIAVAQLRTDGSPDPAFGTGGTVLVSPSHGQALCIQPDGKAVVAGSRLDVSTPSDAVVARLLTDGRPDPTFAANGIAQFDIAGTEVFTSVLCRRDGTIVAGGYTSSTNIRAIPRPLLVGLLGRDAPSEVPVNEVGVLVALALSIVLMARQVLRPTARR